MRKILLLMFPERFQKGSIVALQMQLNKNNNFCNYQNIFLCQN